MNQSFIQLGKKDRAEILQTASAELGITAQILEKDIWVCWALRELFSMPNAHPMAFKGGTSLSKIWNAITRFSEDIDITINYMAFDTGFDHHDGKLSNKKQAEVNDQLRDCVAQYLSGEIIPYLQSRLASELSEEDFELTLSACGEKITLVYPSAITTRNPYIRDSILLEFGGRNTLEPSSDYSVVTYMERATSVEGVDFPAAQNVFTIDASRTFWEKVTLIHAVCGKNSKTTSAERLSRHWYDLHMLLETGSVELEKLLSDETLIREIIALKNVFYYAASAKYEHCLKGQLVLVPEQELLSRIAEDYGAMKDMNLVGGSPPEFEQIQASVVQIQDTVNLHFSE